jgi:hypothetical protein
MEEHPMMSLREIQHVNEEASDRVRTKAPNKQPFVIQDEEQIYSFQLPFPFLGDHVPDGWELLEEPEQLFCDKTGFGSPGELALTHDQLRDRLLGLFAKNPQYGYAITEDGPFQAYVGVYQRTGDS